MAARYWVGGSATWDGTAGTKWALTSGGAGGQAVPTSADDVYLDSGSGAVTVTCSGTSAICNNLVCTGFTGTLTYTSATIQIFGNLTLVSGMTLTTNSSSILLFSATATGKTITWGGKSPRAVTFDGVGGGWTLQSSLSTSLGVLTLTNGALDTNNQAVTCNTFRSNNSNTRSLTLGTSVFTVVGNGGLAFGFTDTTGLTFSGASSTLKFADISGGAITFNGGGQTYGTVQLSGVSGTGAFTITGNNTFSTFSSLRTYAYSILLTDGSNQTITTWSVNGSAGNLVTLTNTASTTAGTLTKAGGGTVTVDYANISWCTGSPGATWSATHSTDGGNNTGWSFGSANSLFFGSNF